MFLRSTWIEIGWRSAVSALSAVAALIIAAEYVDGLAEKQTIVYLVMATVLIGQAFLIGVQDTGDQVARFRHATLWLAVLVSFGLLLAGVYLPGLRAALDLAVPGSTLIAIVGVAVLAGLTAAQLGAVAAVRRRRRTDSQP